jgi:ribosomal protein L24E
VGTKGSFCGGKVAGAWGQMLISILPHIMTWCLNKQRDNLTYTKTFSKTKWTTWDLIPSRKRHLSLLCNIQTNSEDYPVS